MQFELSIQIISKFLGNMVLSHGQFLFQLGSRLNIVLGFLSTKYFGIFLTIRE